MAAGLRGLLDFVGYPASLGQATRHGTSQGLSFRSLYGMLEARRASERIRRQGELRTTYTIERLIARNEAFDKAMRHAAARRAQRTLILAEL